MTRWLLGNHALTARRVESVKPKTTVMFSIQYPFLFVKYGTYMYLKSVQETGEL